MENRITFSAHDTGDYELNIISVLVNQAGNSPSEVARACRYVLDRLEESDGK